VALAQTEQNGAGVSCFKYLYFNLLNVFVVYIFILTVSSAVQVLCKMPVGVSDLIIFKVIFPSAVIVNGIVLTSLIILFSEAVICLKAFIWNIYATFISVLTVSTLLPDEK
jgi:TM2 domain-containing membrane protein YozV